MAYYFHLNLSGLSPLIEVKKDRDDYYLCAYDMEHEDFLDICVSKESCINSKHLSELSEKKLVKLVESKDYFPFLFTSKKEANFAYKLLSLYKLQIQSHL